LAGDLAVEETGLTGILEEGFLELVSRLPPLAERLTTRGVDKIPVQNVE
jgi:hypothetical protein